MLSFAWISAGSAQGGAGYIGFVRSLDASETGQSSPAGLTYSPTANLFYVLGANPQGKALSAVSNISKVDSLAGTLGSTLLAAQVQDPVNLAFDGKAQRLLILQAASRTLAEVPEGASGELEPQKIRSYDISRFGLQNPQGLSVDPASGRLFILDAAGPRLVRVDPAAGGSLDKGAISSVKLSAPGLSSPRGLAFDPSSGHLHVLAGKRLYEFTQAGALVASRDLAEFALGEPQGMVFAPSGDQTDDPLEMSLYLADGSQIVEFTFIAAVQPAAATFNSSLVKTTNMYTTDPAAPFEPPSTDPSGITYVSASNRLVISDGEVEEIVNDPITGLPVTWFQDANVWELNLDGTIIRTANISKVGTTSVPMTNEPTGVTWNPTNGFYYFSDDGNKEIYVLNPGVDGLIGTDDDTWTHFDTLVHGSGDPEGIAFDTVNNHLYVSDGVNMEIYRFALDGTLLGQFDVESLGITHPESVEFNPDNGTLFILESNVNNDIIIETTTSGVLLQTINYSAANTRSAAGLAYAPASNGSGNSNFYIVDRGIDNNADPYAVDGKMFEMTAPVPVPPNSPPVANDDSATTAEDNEVTIDVAANDTDEDGDLDPSSVRTDCAGCSTPAHGSLVKNVNGTFTYIPEANFNGLDSFGYEICDTASACDTAMVTITVTSVNDPPVAGDDQASTDEDTSVDIDVTTNDSDIEGKLVKGSANTDCATCSLPTHGVLTNEGEGIFSYQPDVDFNGSDSFRYQICDAGSLCITAKVSITVKPVNDAPVAKDDDARTKQNAAVTINVASNDNDIEGNLDLTSTTNSCPGCSSPVHGTLVNLGDGRFTYTPETNFSGSDSFVYKICDTLGLCDTATVTIKVSAGTLYYYNFIPISSNG